MVEPKFLRIKCPRCQKAQITFGKASTRVKCNDCNKLLVKLTGGKAKIKARVSGVIKWNLKKTT